MVIPASVRIGGVEYVIRNAENVRNGSDLLYGKIDFENCEIVLSSTDGVGRQRKKLTFLHEMLHGVFWHYWSGQPLENEEELVQALSKGLYQVLEDNKERLFYSEVRQRGEPTTAVAEDQSNG